MRRIRKDDEVVVIAGKDKGRRGKIVRVMDEERVIVAGVFWPGAWNVRADVLRIFIHGRTMCTPFPGLIVGASVSGAVPSQSRSHDPVAMMTESARTRISRSSA